MKRTRQERERDARLKRRDQFPEIALAADYVTVAKLAERTRLNPYDIRKAIKEGVLRAVTINGRVLIPNDDAKQYAEKYGLI